MLTIQSIGYRHSGTYTCTASNDAGSRSQSVQLKVNGGCLKTSKKRERERNYYPVTFPPRTSRPDAIDFWS